MRGDSPATLDDLVGWAAYTSGEPVFHKVKSLDEEPEGSTLTGLSDCGYRLRYVDTEDAIRPYERPCDACFRDRTPRPPRRTRVAQIKPLLVDPVSPVGPLDLRVTYNGHLAVRVAAPEGDWLVIDMARPVMLQWASDEAAAEWRTLRTTWQPEALLNGQWLADRYDVERSLVSHWRRDGVNLPYPPVYIADRPGWYLEQLPLLDKWVNTRQGRRKYPTKGTPPKRDIPKLPAPDVDTATNDDDR